MILETDVVRRAGLATEAAAPPIGDNERDNSVLFSLYPVIDHRSSVELELELRVRPGSGEGSIVIHAGCRIDLTENEIRIAGFDPRTSVTDLLRTSVTLFIGTYALEKNRTDDRKRTICYLGPDGPFYDQ